MSSAESSNALEVSKDAASTVSFASRDGYELTGTLFSAQVAAKGNIVVAGATGVPQGFYRRFALYAASIGFNVLTFDYRGVGLSRSGSLRQFDMNYLDWGRYDLAAAVDKMSEPDTPLYLVGHSFGGHALGLLPNHHLLSAAYSFGSGAGWAGWMPTIEALKVRFMWNIVLPVIVRWKGYMAWSKLGLGEDLPLGVYRDWKRWCKNPRYFFGDEDFKYLIETYANVTIPFVSATASDDLWAPPKSRDSFCQHYSGCDLELKTIETERNKPIGHMGYFRESCKDLWQDMFNWFEELPHTSGQQHESQVL